MARFVFLMLILYILVMAIFGYFNNTTVTVVLFKDRTEELPLWLLVFLSSLIGAGFLFVIYMVRDTRRLFKKMQTQKAQKRAEKLQGLYLKALNEVHAGKDGSAKETLSSLLQIEPDYLPGLKVLADLSLKEGRLDEAEENYRKVLQVSRNDRDALYGLASVKFRQKKPEEALSLIDEVIKADKRDLSALYLKRQILESMKKWDELIELQRSILSLKDEPEERHYLQGYLYEAGMKAVEEEDPEKAKKLFKEALKQDHRFVPAHIGHAEAMLIEDRDRDAIHYLERAFRETGSLVFLARLEDLLLSQGEPSKIIQIYEEALREKPADTALRFFLAKLYYRLQMLDDALETLDQIDDPQGIPDIARLRVAIYLQRGDYQKAAEMLNSILDIKNTLRVPYCCSECGWIQTEWTGRCPFCGKWDTFFFNLHGRCERKVRI